jgi:hypothetical protein
LSRQLTGWRGSRAGAGRARRKGSRPGPGDRVTGAVVTGATVDGFGPGERVRNLAERGPLCARLSASQGPEWVTIPERTARPLDGDSGASQANRP